MARYRIKDQKEALSYIRKRLESEHSMELDVDTLIESFIAMYISSLEGGATKEQLDALVELLAEQLYDDIETLAVDEHVGNRDAILLFIAREWNGKTLMERVEERCMTLANEAFLIYMIGTLMGKTRDFIVSSILKNLDNPYENPLIAEARDMQARGEIVVPTSLEEPHYGRGIVISSRKALIDLSLHALVEGWGMNDYLEHRDKAIGYVVTRGSSYPCDICDSYVGYHDIGDTSSMPMYHNHCRCYVIWVYKEEER